jgi:prolyl-tRNA synthetase
MVPCSAGEDTIVHTEDGTYAANIEKAEVDKPRADETELKAKRESAAAMEMVHTPNVGSIEAVCNFLKAKPQNMIKTLIFTVSFDDAPEVPSRHDESKMSPEEMRATTVICLLRGDHELNENKVKHALGASHIELAGESVITHITGAAIGFAGPQGLAGKVAKMLIDNDVAIMESGITGANKTDYHVYVVPGRDFALTGENIMVADIRNAAEGDTHKGKKLIFSKGIEVGHVFKLGTKYSTKLGANFKDEQGLEHPCIMGCYGIGVNRIMASAIETQFDENGIVWPISIAPFEVIVTPVNQDDEAVVSTSEQIYNGLQAQGIEVLIDDRDARGGVKFKDADLLGIPVRITVGKKSVAEGNVEIKLRTGGESRKTAIKDVVAEVSGMVKEMKEKLNA